MSFPSATTASAPNARFTIGGGWLAVGLGAVAVALRWKDFGASRPLWTDEAIAVYIARAESWSDLFARSRAWDMNPPLHNVLLHLAGSFSWSEAILRLPSLVATLGGIALLALCVRRLAGNIAGAWFATVACAAQPLVFYAREARPYGLSVLALAAILLAWLRIRETGRGWIAFAVAMMLGMATMYQLWVVGALIALTTLRRTDASIRAPARFAVLTGTILGVVAIVFYCCFFPRSTGGYEQAFYRPFFPGSAALSERLSFVGRATCAIGRYMIIGETPGARWLLVGSGIGLLMLGASAYGLVRSFKSPAPAAELHRITWAALAVFGVLALLRLHPYGAARHCLPLAILLLASSIVALGEIARGQTAWLNHAGGTAMLVVALGASLRVPTPSWYRVDFPGLLADLRRMTPPPETIVPINAAIFGVLHYSRPDDPWHASLSRAASALPLRLAEADTFLRDSTTTRVVIWNEGDDDNVQPWLKATFQPGTHYQRSQLHALVVRSR